MPRHLIGDAHEWMNEIPTVPTCDLAKPQPRERAWTDAAGKEDPVELDSSLKKSWIFYGVACRGDITFYYVMKDETPPRRMI